MLSIITEGEARDDYGYILKVKGEGWSMGKGVEHCQVKH